LKRNKKKSSNLFTVIILLVFGSVTGAITLLVLYFYPVSILTCRYVETEQVDCKLQERMIGLIPLQEISIVQLKKAHIVTKVQEVRRDGREVDIKSDRMILNCNSGTVALNSFDEFGGFFVKQTVNKINDFLRAYNEEPVRIWQATWVPLIICSFFFLVSVIMLYAAVDILIRGMIGKFR